MALLLRAVRLAQARGVGPRHAQEADTGHVHHMAGAELGCASG